jgi:spermidine/putrescine transport system ATP-binding protein
MTATLSNNSATPAVELRDVFKTFPAGRSESEVAAVNGVDLVLPSGEFFTLLGPSGCGKTTTLRMIAGFEIPTAGEIYIQGNEMSRVPPYRRPVNTVFQNYALFPHLTIEKNVAFGLNVKKVSKAEQQRRVEEALALVQLPTVGQRKPTQLSGGQQQRVALARALINRPAVLLLDEPLGALDYKLRQAMQLELKALQLEVGITFVYVTHDQEEALTMSDRIAVMEGGRLLQVGTPEQIYAHPRTRFVADFIGDTNLLAGTTRGPGAVELADGTTIRVDHDEPVGTGVTIAIRPEHVGLRGTDVDRDPSLDAVEGRVERVTFLGNATRYEVVAGSGDATTTIHVRQGNAPGVQHFAAGDPVRARWAPTSAHVLED